MLSPHVALHFRDIELNNRELGHKGGENHWLLCLVLRVVVLPQDVAERPTEDWELLIGCCTGELNVPWLSCKWQETTPDIEVDDPIPKIFKSLSSVFLSIIDGYLENSTQSISSGIQLLGESINLYECVNSFHEISDHPLLLWLFESPVPLLGEESTEFFLLFPHFSSEADLAIVVVDLGPGLTRGVWTTCWVHWLVEVVLHDRDAVIHNWVVKFWAWALISLCREVIIRLNHTILKHVTGWRWAIIRNEAAVIFILLFLIFLLPRVENSMSGILITILWVWLSNKSKSSSHMPVVNLEFKYLVEDLL